MHTVVETESDDDDVQSDKSPDHAEDKWSPVVVGRERGRHLTSRRDRRELIWTMDDGRQRQLKREQI